MTLLLPINWKTGRFYHLLPILVYHFNLWTINPQGWSVYSGKDWSKRAVCPNTVLGERQIIECPSVKMSANKRFTIYCENEYDNLIKASSFSV